MKKNKRILCLCLSLVMVFMFTGCGASSSMDSMASVPQASFNGAMMDMETGGGIKGGSFFEGALDFKAESEEVYVENIEYDSFESSTSVVAPESPKEETIENDTEEYLEKKVVYYANMSLQTKNMDEALNQLMTSLDEYEGYISYQSDRKSGDIFSEYRTRSSDIEIRIPSKHFNVFLSGIESENIYIRELTRDSIDYSESYYDKQTRVDSLKIQEQRLFELLRDADSVEIMLEIERNLTDVRYEIESLTKEMKFIDSQVAYSTITIFIEEVIKYDEVRENPKTFIEELSDVIHDSGEDFVDMIKELVFIIVYNAPFVIFLVVVILFVRFFVVKVIRKKRGKKIIKKIKEVEEKKEE